MNTQKIPCIICVSENDLQYLFEFSLKSCLKNLDFLTELFVITPNTELATKLISEKILPLNIAIHLIKDDEFLSKNEIQMCGWSKQQILKLRSNEISNADNFLSVGSDTIILNKLLLNKFYSPANIISHYRIHEKGSKHLDFEVNRVKCIYDLLEINSSKLPEIARDFIFDIFLFNSKILVELKNYLTKKFGVNYTLRIFPFRVGGYFDTGRIGEWTMYTIFAIEMLKFPIVFQDGSLFLHQIHTQRELKEYNYVNEAVHFERKDFNKEFIISELKKHNFL